MADVTQARLTDENHPDVPGLLPRGVVVYEISGPLFFGAAQKAMAVLEIVAGQTKVVILLMDQVHAMDATGLVALESALEQLRKHKCLAILSNVRAQPMGLLEKAHLAEHEGVVLCGSATKALASAVRHLGVGPTLMPEPPADAQDAASRK